MLSRLEGGSCENWENAARSQEPNRQSMRAQITEK